MIGESPKALRSLALDAVNDLDEIEHLCDAAEMATASIDDATEREALKTLIGIIGDRVKRVSHSLAPGGKLAA